MQKNRFWEICEVLSSINYNNYLLWCKQHKQKKHSLIINSSHYLRPFSQQVGTQDFLGGGGFFIVLVFFCVCRFCFSFLCFFFLFFFFFCHFVTTIHLAKILTTQTEKALNYALQSLFQTFQSTGWCVSSEIVLGGLGGFGGSSSANTVFISCLISYYLRNEFNIYSFYTI